MNLSLKGFKKVSSNKTHTIFEHPEGHVIHVAHENVSKKQKSEMGKLERMADGGMVADRKSAQPQPSPQPPPQPTDQDTRASISKGFNQALGFKNGGMVPHDGHVLHLAEGTDIPIPKDPELRKLIDKQPEGEAAEAPPSQPAEPNWMQSVPRTGMVGNLLHGMGDVAQWYASQDQGGDKVSNGEDPRMVPNSGPYRPAGQAPQQPSGPMPDITGANTEYDLLSRGEQNIQSGLAQERDATQQLGKEQAGLYANQANQMAALQQRYQNHYNELDGELKGFMSDLQNQHIDPDRYIRNMSGGQRILTALGMIIGGAGAGASGQPNMAMEFLNKQIDHDIKSQEADIGNKKTLLEANFRRFGNMRDAMEMTRAMETAIIESKLKGAVAKSSNPMAIAQYLQKSGMQDINYGQMIAPIAARRALMEHAGQAQAQPGKPGGVQPSLMIDMMYPEKDKEEAQKDLTKATEIRNAQQHAMEVFKKVRELNSLKGYMQGGFNPLQIRSQIKAMTDPLEIELARTMAQRVSEFEIQGMKSSLPNFLDTSNKVLDAKQDALNKQFEKAMAFPRLQKFKDYGIDLTPPAPSFSKPSAHKKLK